MANRIYDALRPIKASEELKSATIARLRAERERRTADDGQSAGTADAGRTQSKVWPGSFTFSARRLSAAFGLVLLLTAGIGGYAVIQTPVSYISIDVNPSIELALNRLDRVVSAAAYNEDGEIVLDGVSVKGKPYAEAIDTIVESDAMSKYLSKDAALTFTVASKNDEKEVLLQAGVEQSHGCSGHGGRSYSADVDLVTEAHGHGVSFGKYAAYLELAQYDESVTVDDCRGMSMKEIHSQIEAHEHGCGNQRTVGTDAQSGSSGETAAAGEAQTEAASQNSCGGAVQRGKGHESGHHGGHHR